MLSGFCGPPRHDFALDLQGVHLFLEPQAESDLVNVVALILPGFQGLPEVVQEDRRRLRREMVDGRAVLHQLGFLRREGFEHLIKLFNR